MKLFLSALTVIGLVTAAHRTAVAESSEQGATYVSPVDASLTIRKITVLPVSDNLEGIYAHPAEVQLITLVRDSHRWDFVDAQAAGALPAPIATIGELEEDPELMKKIVQNVDTDAVLAAGLTRGPNGISVRLDLFLKSDGKLMAQELLRDHQRFEVAELREQLKIMYQKLVSHLPYDGLVLSRQGNRVTVNLGKSDGLSKDQVITVVQIFAVNRHPKFGFIVSSEKEILGQIKIAKVDDTLSFGLIISEKERNAIQKLSKISGINQFKYDDTDSLTQGSSQRIGDRPESKLIFGKDPKEWLPVRSPTFGLVRVDGALGIFSNHVDLASQGLQGDSIFYPSLHVGGDLWITPEWTFRADVSQGVVSTSNPRSGSSPSSLNEIMGRYDVLGVYNFLLRDEFFGPKIELSFGYALYKTFVDSSSPVAFTTTNFSGLILGLGGSFPVTADGVWFAGGQFNIWLLPTLNEEPVTSGASNKPTVTEFSLFGEEKIAENIRLHGALNFASYGATFSGYGTRVNGSGAAEKTSSLSISQTTLSCGLVYMF
jgi:hypothetical protein